MRIFIDFLEGELWINTCLDIKENLFIHVFQIPICVIFCLPTCGGGGGHWWLIMVLDLGLLIDWLIILIINVLYIVFVYLFIYFLQKPSAFQSEDLLPFLT